MTRINWLIQTSFVLTVLFSLSLPPFLARGSLSLILLPLQQFCPIRLLHWLGSSSSSYHHSLHRPSSSRWNPGFVPFPFHSPHLFFLSRALTASLPCHISRHSNHRNSPRPLNLLCFDPRPHGSRSRVWVSDDGSNGESRLDWTGSVQFPAAADVYIC